MSLASCAEAQPYLNYFFLRCKDDTCLVQCNVKDKGRLESASCRILPRYLSVWRNVIAMQDEFSALSSAFTVRVVDSQNSAVHTDQVRWVYVLIRQDASDPSHFRPAARSRRGLFGAVSNIAIICGGAWRKPWSTLCA